MPTSLSVRDVHVIVCTHNSRRIIGDTLDAIAAQTIGCPVCTVIDGRSSDGTVEYVRTAHPWARVIVKDLDSGPAASRNIGIRGAETPLVGLVDSDVRLRPDWLERQLAFLTSNEDVVVVGGLLVEHDDEDRINIGHGALNRYGIAWDEQKGAAAVDVGPPRRCIWVATAAVLVRRNETLALGGFDERMFAFHEDVDFGWRANIFGMQVAFNPQAVAVHRAHASLHRSKIGGRATYLLWRNRLRSALINYQFHNVLRFVGAYLVLGLPILVLQPERKEKIAAVLWNIRWIADIWSRRRFVQRGRRMPDRALRPMQDTRLRGPGR
jgi:GT2 family glycosyltransferase